MIRPFRQKAAKIAKNDNEKRSASAAGEDRSRTEAPPSEGKTKRTVNFRWGALPSESGALPSWSGALSFGSGALPSEGGTLPFGGGALPFGKTAKTRLSGNARSPFRIKVQAAWGSPPPKAKGRRDQGTKHLGKHPRECAHARFFDFFIFFVFPY